MKKIYFLVAILFASCYSSKFTAVSIKPISDVVQLNGGKDKLFVKANGWMAETFVNSKSVIQFRDKETGTIIGKYMLHEGEINHGAYGIKTLISEDAYAIIKIRVKDNAAKILVKPNAYKYRQSPYGDKYDFNKQKAIKRINNLVTDFKSYMKTGNNFLDWKSKH